MRNKKLFSVISTIMLVGLLVFTACPGSEWEPELPNVPYYDDADDYAKIGEIYGTITLTDVPDPAPKVYICVYGYNADNFWQSKDSQINFGSESGTLTNIQWSIPIYEDDGFFSATGYFELYVVPDGRDDGFSVKIPTSKSITNKYQNVGNLGTVSINSIILSGNLNVTYDGAAMPFVKIVVYTLDLNTYESLILPSPATDAPWSIFLSSFSSSTQVFFNVSGYSADGNEMFFSRNILPSPIVYAYDQNVTGINFDIGNIPNQNTPVSPVPLTADTWVDSEIENDGDVHWYSINVAGGTNYYIWWNDEYRGNNTKTLDIDVYAYDSSKNLISLTANGTKENDSAWNTPVSFTASSNGTVYVKVRAYNYREETGTYAIVYSASNSRPANDGISGSKINPIPLTAGEWYDDEINESTLNREVWYSFDVTKGTTYYVWWNDGYTGSGNGIKTLDVKVDAYLNGSSISISGFSGLDSAWTTYKSFIPDSSGTVNLKVYPYTNGNTGTYAIVYSTSSTKPSSPYLVTFNSNGGTGTVSPIVANPGSSITLPSGDGLSKSDYVFGGWNTSSLGTGTNYNAGISYTVNGNITLYAKWNNTALGSEINPIPLTADTLVDGDIVLSTQEIWYSFNVTSGTTYYVWWNDRDEGPTPKNKTGDVVVGARYENAGTFIFGGSNYSVDKGWNMAQAFTANQNGTVYIRVIPFAKNFNYIGTFAIVYSTISTRPSN